MKITLLMIALVALLNAELTKVTLVLPWKNQFQFAGYYTAVEKGFYREMGLDVKIMEYDLHRDNAKEVADGKFDFGVGHSSLILEKVQKNRDIAILAAINQSSPLVLVSKKRNDLKSLEDISGKKIMMNNDQTYTASINAMLSWKNLDQDSFKVITTSFDVIDIVNSNADLMVSYIANEPFALQEKGIEYTIFDPREYGYDFYSDILFTSTKLINRDPILVDNFYKATIKGWKYAYENIDESVEIILNKYNTQNKSKKALLYEADVLKKLSIVDGVKFGSINIDRLKEITTTYKLLKLIDANSTVDFSDLIYYTISQRKFLLTADEKKYLKNKNILKVCIQERDMPYQGYIDGEFTGIVSEYLSKFSKNTDISFEPVHVKSTEESISHLKSSKCDIVPVYKDSEIDDNDLSLTIPYIKIPMALVTLKENSYLYDENSIKEKSIALLDNKFNRSYYHSYNTKTFPDIQSSVNSVIIGLNFGCIGNLIDIKKDISSDKIDVNYNINKNTPISMLVRSNDKKLLSILTKEIALGTTNTQYAILNRWLNAQYIKSFDYTIVWIVISIMGMITLLIYLTKLRVNRLLKLKSIELNKQLEIFSKNVPVSKTDTNGVITYVSEEFCNLTGYTDDELIGSKHSILKDSETSKEVYSDMWLSIKSSHIWRGTLKNRNKDGSECWVNVVISPIIENGVLAGFSSIRKDITLEHVLKEFNTKLEEEVKLRTLELEQLAKYKKNEEIE
ncbi:MAG: ABC transporter substrate-binding protein [Campylobacterota bacterium]|nr:ABC transporter substrate-binding protein [Campylobacterota bacterium]